MAKWAEIKCPRCTELEAKLAKAVEALTKAAEYHEDERTWWDIDRSKDIRATIEELKGETGE